MALRINNSEAWQSHPQPAAAARVRRGAAAAAAGPDLPKQFLRDDVEVERVEIIEPRVTRAAAPPPPLIDLSVDLAPGELAVMAMRHPSGALTFHADVDRGVAVRGARRGARKRTGTARFRIPVRTHTVAPSDGRVRRGIFKRVFKAIVLKVKEAVVDRAVSIAADFVAKGVEKLWWNARDLEQGWLHVTPDALRTGDLPKADFSVLDDGPRALLLLHGTFSNAASAFGPLADTTGDFFGSLQPLYGDRMFAFNHFTLSRSPEENARMLLEGLPDRRTTFDVITHSRGGLVLRQLVERRDTFGALGDRFELGHAVLVASPNAGTPLATPKRWEETFGLVATILEMFPDNPWTTGPEFVANGIVWLAGHVIADLPGLAAMDANGTVIGDLQSPPGPNADAYSALAANYHPDDGVLAKLMDLGVDGFFSGANDLVVPTEGGWLVDAASGPAIPGDRIGCFGRGGNLDTTSGDSVHHLSFFKQPETVQFLVRALKDEPHGLPPVDPLEPLPMRVFFRGGAAAARLPVRRPAAPAPAPARPVQRIRAEAATAAPEFLPPLARSDTFQIMILGGATPDSETQVLAMFGSARVIEPFATRNTPADADTEASRAGTRFNQIIRIHERVRNCLSGVPNRNGEMPRLPDDDELRQFGELLFDSLFTGNVRRLYDVARSDDRDGPLNVIFTCTIPWIADKPWEFAFDPSRRKFLATEEIHFVRNAITAVPAQRRKLHTAPLRILVVAAQPQGAAELDSAQEQEVIKHGFRELIDARLAEVDVITNVTPARLHNALLNKAHEAARAGQSQSEAYDVVHFIGHGDFDRDAHKGVLLFETADGGTHEVGAQTLKEVLCGRGIQLIFLNACESARDDFKKRNRGLAQALMEGGVPAIVANQYKVLDPSAIAFAQHFYWGLAQGASLGAAAREARISVNYSLSGEVIDWAVPVLYARDPDFQLCQPSSQRVSMPVRAAGPATRPQGRPARTGRAIGAPRTPRAIREAAGRRVYRVAVADLDRTFPTLDAILQRLNAVQPRFQFERVNIDLPVDSWCIYPGEKRGDNAVYLNANRFAGRIEKKPEELGVDILGCITSWPMLEFKRKRNGELGQGSEVYTWWPDEEGAPKIMLFSTADLPIPPSGPKTDAAIANFIGGTLAGLLANCDVHKSGPKNCALYYDPDPTLATISARQFFCDKVCRAKLQKAIPQDVSALEAILRAFHGEERAL